MARDSIIAAALAAALSLAGCGTKPDIDHLKTYSDKTIAFSYPGNWKITENVTETGPPSYRYLFVESPGSAIFSISEFYSAVPMDLKTYVLKFLESQQRNTQDAIKVGSLDLVKMGETSLQDIDLVIMGRKREGFKHTFTLTLLDTKVPHIAHFYAIDDAQDETLILMDQAPEEDAAGEKPGFDAIYGSLKLK